MKDKISTFVNSKTFYIVLSIALAICAWMLVLSYTNPIETRTLEIQIQFLNEDAPANLDLQDQTVTYPKTATVTVSGRQDTLNNLVASELEATVDFSEITSAGITKLNVSKPTCERLGVTVDDYYPKTIEFTYDTITRKNLEIRIKYDASLLKDGYEFISVTSTLNSIPVSGFASLLNSCEYIQVDLTDSIEAGTLDSDKTVAFLGRYISVTGEDITHRFTAEQITVNIQVAKKVPLTYSVTGTPNSNYYLNHATVSPSYVLLKGNTETLDGIATLSVGNVSISGARQTVTKDIALADVLPAGVTLAENNTARITAEILKYETKQFTVNMSNISLAGTDSERYTYEITPESRVISVQGRQDDISELTLASLAPTLDLQNKTNGTYNNVRLTFPGLDRERFTPVGEYLFTVVISNKQNNEEPTPSPAQATSEENDSKAESN